MVERWLFKSKGRRRRGNKEDKLKRRELLGGEMRRTMVERTD